MRILLIRHGDPDYVHDSLTEKGFREAQALAEYLKNEDLGDCYVSTCGRAIATAEPTLKLTGKTAVRCDWMREFSEQTILRPDKNGDRKLCWDWLPQDWTKYEEFYRYDEWYKNPIMEEGGIGEYARSVTEPLDALLAENGYVRDGHIYRVEKASDKTLTLFCHFGVGCVMLGHLIGCSPMVLWHGFAAAPSSVTTIMTEERRKGIASFRIWSYGDTEHLYAKGEPRSFSARFCECYDFENERHD